MRGAVSPLPCMPSCSDFYFCTHLKGLTSFLLKSLTSLYQDCTAAFQSWFPFGLTPLLDDWYTFWPTENLPAERNIEKGLHLRCCDSNMRIYVAAE